MVDPELTQYAYLWKQQRHQIALFTVTCYGKIEYLIYNLPTKRISLIADTDIGKKLITKLLAEGVPLLEEPPEIQCDRVKAVRAQAELETV